MTFGDMICILAVYAACWGLGALIGMLIKGFLKDYTMVVLAIMYIALFIGFVCVNGGYTVMEVIEEILDMDLLDGIFTMFLPGMAIAGSAVGQKFRLRIERR